MSYGKQITKNGETYLIEKFDKHIYIAKRSNKKYESIYEGDYEDLFCFKEDKEALKDLDYDSLLNAILERCI